MKRTIARLVLVYDAPSGKLAALADSLKKLAGKGCPLCAVTHGLAGMRPEWKTFESALGVPVSYVHRDEAGALLERRPGLRLPCILADLEGGGELVLVDAESIERFRGARGDLKDWIGSRAAALDLELRVS